MLNEDFRFMPRLLDMDLSWRDWFWARSSTLRARSRELERLRDGPLIPLSPLVAVDGGEVVEDVARREAAARLRGEAVGEAR